MLLLVQIAAESFQTFPEVFSHLLQIAAESFQTFLNFLPNGPHKITFGSFEIFEFLIFNNFFFRK